MGWMLVLKSIFVESDFELADAGAATAVCAVNTDAERETVFKRELPSHDAIDMANMRMRIWFISTLDLLF